MSVKVAGKGSETGNVSKFTINSNQGGKAVDLRGGFVQLIYTESIMSDTITASFLFADSGASVDGKSVRDGLPLVGEERVELAFEDNAENKIEVLRFRGNYVRWMGRRSSQARPRTSEIQEGGTDPHF